MNTFDRAACIIEAPRIALAMSSGQSYLRHLCMDGVSQSIRVESASWHESMDGDVPVYRAWSFQSPHSLCNCRHHWSSQLLNCPNIVGLYGPIWASSIQSTKPPRLILHDMTINSLVANYRWNRYFQYFLRVRPGKLFHPSAVGPLHLFIVRHMHTWGPNCSAPGPHDQRFVAENQ